LSGNRKKRAPKIGAPEFDCVEKTVLDELDLAGAAVPPHHFLVAVGNGRHVAANGRLLPDNRVGYDFGFALDRVEPVTDVRLDRLIVVARQVEMLFLARLDLVGSLATE
jgi:hypothetical protein